MRSRGKQVYRALWRYCSATAFILTVPAACGKDADTGIGSGIQTGSIPGANRRKIPAPEAEICPKSRHYARANPVPQDEAFAEGVESVLEKAMTEVGNMSSAQLDLLFNPASKSDETKSNYTRSEVTVSNPDDTESEAITMIMESTLDASTGDTSMELSLASGSEVAQSGGIYFTATPCS
jgi:hypothetical protein